MKLVKPNTRIDEYSDSILIAPAFCTIVTFGISNGSHGGINNSCIPSANCGRICSIDD